MPVLYYLLLFLLQLFPRQTSCYFQQNFPETLLVDISSSLTELGWKPEPWLQGKHLPPSAVTDVTSVQQRRAELRNTCWEHRLLRCPPEEPAKAQASCLCTWPNRTASYSGPRVIGMGAELLIKWATCQFHANEYLFRINSLDTFSRRAEAARSPAGIWAQERVS